MRSVDRVDITDVENPVDNVEKPSVSGERAVENPVDEVDKKLHRGCQNNSCGDRPSGIFWAKDFSSSGSYINGSEDCLPQNIDTPLPPGTILDIGDENNRFRLE